MLRPLLTRHITLTSCRSPRRSVCGVGLLLECYSRTDTKNSAIPLVLGGALLSFNVVKQRIDLNTFQGDKAISKDGKEAAGVLQPDGNTYDPLLMATRVHANLMENMPITLVLAALAEINGADRKKLTYALAAFSLIRLSHVIGLNGNNQPARAVGRFSGKQHRVECLTD